MTTFYVEIYDLIVANSQSRLYRIIGSTSSKTVDLQRSAYNREQRSRWKFRQQLRTSTDNQEQWINNDDGTRLS
jgi:hypothetical protein